MHAINFALKRAHLCTVSVGQRMMNLVVPQMTPARFDLLYYIRRGSIIAGTERLAPGTRKQRDIVRTLGLHKTTVAKMIRRLEEMGWLTRKRDYADRRIKLVSLTKKGLRAIGDAMRFVFRRRALAKPYDRIARLFDLPLAKAEELVRRIEDPAAWKPGWVPGMLSINVRPGPAYPQAMGGFGKLTPGWTFPHHDHVGEETTVVLEGGFRDTHDGAETWRGDELWKPPGTDHEFIVLPGVECIAAVIAVGGVTFR